MSIKRALLPGIRQRDAGSKVEATSLTGCGIPRFKQSIMSAMTESDSHAVPNKHSKLDKTTGDWLSESICSILLYTIRQWHSLISPCASKSSCGERDSCCSGHHPGSWRTMPASPQSRQVQDNCTMCLTTRTPVSRHQHCVACARARMGNAFPHHPSRADDMHASAPPSEQDAEAFSEQAATPASPRTCLAASHGSCAPAPAPKP